MLGNRSFHPFATRGRRMIGAILLTFGLFSALSVTLSIWAASRSQNQAVVVELAARQRTLAERYVKELLLVRTGAQADPERLRRCSPGARACCSMAERRRRSKETTTRRS